MNFRLALQATLSGLPWQHDFESTSVSMAINTAKKWLEQPNNIPSSVMGAYLYDMSTEKLITYFEIVKTVTVTVTERA